MKKNILFLIFIIALISGCATSNKTTEHNGIIIALLDTGVSTTAIKSEYLLPGWNYVLSSKDTEDRINHGTAVASVLLGCEAAGIEAMAPQDCSLVPLVVMDKTDDIESVSPEILAQAIRDAVDSYGADIINISLGIQTDDDLVRKAIEYAEKCDVLVVSAVGNDGESTAFYYPASYETVLGIGSHNKNGFVSDFSQKNGTAALLAPGEDIWLASRNGKTYGSRGTSYATAYVTAAAAQLLAMDPWLSAAELRDIMCSSAEDVGTPGFDVESGWGLLRTDHALMLLAAKEE